MFQTLKLLRIFHIILITVIAVSLCSCWSSDDDLKSEEEEILVENSAETDSLIDKSENKANGIVSKEKAEPETSLESTDELTEDVEQVELKLKEGEQCSSNSECESGICDRFYKDTGMCAPEECVEGVRADNNHYYCDRNGNWRKSKNAGGPCKENYECYEANCFMNPMCDLNPPDRAICENNVCVHIPSTDECVGPGMVRALRKDQYWEGCVESLAQMILPTVCIPCGNGVCDEEESECNCPEDCDPEYDNIDLESLDSGLIE